MNPLLKKEIRLILPAWGITILLVLAPHILPHQNPDQYDLMWPVWLGVLVLCASSFGREFSLGTFSSLLALPVPRKQFWFIKLSVLLAALLSILLCFFISLGFFHSLVARPGDGPSAVMLGLFLLSAVAGGLWLALLIRQTIAVVWLIVLVPFLLCAPLLFLLSRFNAADQTVEITMDALLLVYSVAGIAGSWVIFQRAQDAPWSGSTINLPDWMSAGILQRSGSDERLRVPWRALIWKEFHFNQVPLLGMGVLFLVHLGVIGLRYLHRNPDRTDFFWRDMDSALQAICFLWVIAPLIIGCTSIAEERKLGTMEGQLCQPVSTRRQFLVKFGFVIVMGGLLSPVLLYLAEGIGMAIGAYPYHQAKDSSELIFDGASLKTSIPASFLAIAIIGFFASSLARNLLQALPIAIGMVVGIGFAFSAFDQLSGFGTFSLFSDFPLWNPLLPCIILGLSLTIALPWLTYRNFRSLHESARIWRRNGLGLAAVLLFTMAASVFIYHRTWEKFTPLEPAHGAAVFPPDQPLKSVPMALRNNLQIALPGGRVWFACLADPWPEPWLQRGFASYCRQLLDSEPPPRLELGNFLPGSDWASLSAGYVDVWLDTNSVVGDDRNPAHYIHEQGGRETVGVRRDGTLWVSEKPDPTGWNTTPLVQYGAETNWLAVAAQRSITSVVLLKKNGTLWRWGEPTNSWHQMPATWPGLRAQPPRQIGTDADWRSLVRLTGLVAQKKNGTIWNLEFDDKTRRDEVTLNTNLDQAGFTHERLDHIPLTALDYDNGLLAGIHADGTLWVLGHLYWDKPNRNSSGSLQCGRETNWVAVAAHWKTMVTLKSDGTLWRWGGHFSQRYQEPAERLAAPPERLGIHQDWIALTQTWDGVVSLAADGSLWLWRLDDNFNAQGFVGNDGTLIEPSEKPVLLGNILAAN